MASNSCRNEYVTSFLISVLEEGRDRLLTKTLDGVPKDDAGVAYPPRTFAYNMRIFSGTNFKKGALGFYDTLRTFFYPSILFVTLLNGSVIASAFAAAFTTAPALLTAPWS